MPARRADIECKGEGPAMEKSRRQPAGERRGQRLKQPRNGKIADLIVHPAVSASAASTTSNGTIWARAQMPWRDLL